LFKGSQFELKFPGGADTWGCLYKVIKLYYCECVNILQSLLTMYYGRSVLKRKPGLFQRKYKHALSALIHMEQRDWPKPKRNKVSGRRERTTQNTASKTHRSTQTSIAPSISYHQPVLYIIPTSRDARVFSPNIFFTNFFFSHPSPTIFIIIIIIIGGAVLSP
jgi:hypothetical protein